MRKLTMPNGSRLRARRLTLGLSQVAVATRAGIDQPALSQMERGKRVGPLSTWLALARALDCAVEEIAPEERRA